MIATYTKGLADSILEQHEGGINGDETDGFLLSTVVALLPGGSLRFNIFGGAYYFHITKRYQRNMHYYQIVFQIVDGNRDTEMKVNSKVRYRDTKSEPEHLELK